MCGHTMTKFGGHQLDTFSDLPHMYMSDGKKLGNPRKPWKNQDKSRKAKEHLGNTKEK